MMGFLWLWNVALLAVVTPGLVVVLRRVVVAAGRVSRTLEEITAVGRAMLANLDTVRTLAETERLVGKTATGLARYGRALDEIL